MASGASYPAGKAARRPYAAPLAHGLMLLKMQSENGEEGI